MVTPEGVEPRFPA